ncbi:MAG: ABC transporter substrate-binding protein, partial [Actinomycetota bacterium]|nr:ABC transporter substrate-binding protein [Actinomycetota bacterium]
MRVHKGKALVAGLAALALALTGCSSSKGGKGGGTNADTSGTKGTGMFADCSKSANDCNNGKTKKGGTLTYTLEKTIGGWNINTSNSNTFEFAEVMDGVVSGAFTATPDLKPVLNEDMMTSAEQTKADPQTLVYKVKSEAIWSDGQPVDFKDFEYAAKTSDGTSCPDCGAASTSGYDQIASMTPSDNGKTITVVMKKPYSDWQGMFGTLYPAHIAAQHGDLTTPKGLATSFLYLDKTQPTYSSGPYMVQAAVKDTSVTEVPNPKWYGKVKPSLDKLVFRIITEQTQEVPALQNNE